MARPGLTFVSLLILFTLFSAVEPNKSLAATGHTKPPSKSLVRLLGENRQAIQLLHRLTGFEVEPDHVLTLIHQSLNNPDELRIKGSTTLDSFKLSMGQLNARLAAFEAVESRHSTALENSAAARKAAADFIFESFNSVSEDFTRPIRLKRLEQALDKHLEAWKRKRMLEPGATRHETPSFTQGEALLFDKDSATPYSADEIEKLSQRLGREIFTKFKIPSNLDAVLKILSDYLKIETYRLRKDLRAEFRTYRNAITPKQMKDVHRLIGSFTEVATTLGHLPDSQNVLRDKFEHSLRSTFSDLLQDKSAAQIVRSVFEATGTLGEGSLAALEEFAEGRRLNTQLLRRIQREKLESENEESSEYSLSAELPGVDAESELPLESVRTEIMSIQKAVEAQSGPITHGRITVELAARIYEAVTYLHEEITALQESRKFPELSEGSGPELDKLELTLRELAQRFTQDPMITAAWKLVRKGPYGGSLEDPFRAISKF